MKSDSESKGEDVNPSNIKHYPVLYDSVLKVTNPKEGDIVLDVTLGRGGHAALIMPKIGKTGWYIGLDCDDEAIAFCRKKFGLDPSSPSTNKPECRVDFIKSNFSKVKHVLKKLGLKDRGVDILLADLGLLFYLLLLLFFFEFLLSYIHIFIYIRYLFCSIRRSRSWHLLPTRRTS